MIMAVVATGALAGVELTLAQELQYVLGNTPLQAGIFIIPIMAAAAVGGPVAGYLFNLCGLRTVASSSRALSAVALCYLAQADFHSPDFWVPTMLALLGLPLSIGLTASSLPSWDRWRQTRGPPQARWKRPPTNSGPGSGSPSSASLCPVYSAAPSCCPPRRPNHSRIKPCNPSATAILSHGRWRSIRQQRSSRQRKRHSRRLIRPC